MSAGRRPLSVLILCCLYIAVGAIGFVYHVPRPSAFRYEDLWIEATELLALVAGVFMLLGRNWARWLSVAWISFHVVISFPMVRQIAIHALLLAVVVSILFQSRAGQYFASKNAERNR